MYKHNTTENNENQDKTIPKMRKKKMSNEALLKLAVNTMSEGNIKRLESCGTFMSFVADEGLNKKKLKMGVFCHNRFCPICAWRQAKKDALKIDIIMRWIEKEHGKSFVFLTLTAPNVTGPELKDKIKEFNKAFKNMMLRKDIMAMNRGYVRKLEVTYNKENNTYHPHFHVILAVNKSYFTDRTYISQKKWLNHWRWAMKDESITQVDVRKINRDSAGKEQAEIAKYAAKDSDMLISQEVFDTFYKSLKGCQVITFNGLFTEGNKLYKAKKLDAYKEIDLTVYVYMLLYQWGKKEYIEKERRELTPSELQKYNKQLIDEADEVDTG